MSTSEKPKPIITGDSQAQGIAKFASRVTYEDLTPERRERLKVSVLDSLAMRHQRPRSAPNRGVSGTGKTVRRFGRSMHFDRRRESQRRLRSSVQHGARPIHRLHGQLSWRGGTLSPVGQRWISPGRVRARGTIRQRILDRPGGCLPSRVGTNFQRSIHGRRV